MEALDSQMKDFIRIQAPVVALEHLRVIDGTGAILTSEQTILISGDKIKAIASSASVAIPPNAACRPFRVYGNSWVRGNARPSLLCDVR